MSLAARSPAATLGSKPSLPFILETPPPPSYDAALLYSILDRLDRLQALSTSSQVELASLRALNTEILETVRQRLLPAPAPPDVAAPAAAAPAPSRLSLRLLGSFEARLEDRAVTAWPGRKARLLLAYLALERGRMVPKDVLIELFWPEARADRGANNLSIAVYQIRSSLASVLPDGAQAVVVRQGLYGLDPECVQADLWELQREFDAGRRALERRDRAAARDHLRRAIGLCRGELLASDPYEEWTAEPRRALNTAWHQALTWLATEAQAAGDWPEVQDLAGRLLQRDACDEAGHRLLIEAHLALGNRSQALQQYQLCLQTLRSELGVGPSPETQRLGERLAA